MNHVCKHPIKLALNLNLWWWSHWNVCSSEATNRCATCASFRFLCLQRPHCVSVCVCARYTFCLHACMLEVSFQLLVCRNVSLSVKEKKRDNIMQSKHCVLPRSRPMPRHISFALCVLGKSMLLLHWSMVIVSTVNCSPLKCIALTSHFGWGSRGRSVPIASSLWSRSGCPLAWFRSTPQHLFGSGRGQYISYFWRNGFRVPPQSIPTVVLHIQCCLRLERHLRTISPLGAHLQRHFSQWVRLVLRCTMPLLQAYQADLMKDLSTAFHPDRVCLSNWYLVAFNAEENDKYSSNFRS